MSLEEQGASEEDLVSIEFIPCLHVPVLDLLEFMYNGRFRILLLSWYLAAGSSLLY